MKLPYAQDQWSLGIILLEILTGSWIVQSLDSFSKINELLAMLKKHLDPRLTHLLEWLLLKEELRHLHSFLNEVLRPSPAYIKEEMLKMIARFKSDRELSMYHSAIMMQRKAQIQQQYQLQAKREEEARQQTRQ